MRRMWGVVLVVGLVGSLTAIWPVGVANAEVSFGDSPLDLVIAAAAEHKACGLTTNRLAALTLAPTYPETGAGAADATPSPMTLSRYDNQTGLHSFGTVATHSKAFWHPGIGAWQFDSAGGWGLTAAESIDVATIAGVAAEVIADRWCDVPSNSYVWGPWFGCNNGECQSIYADIYTASTDTLSDVSGDSTVSRYGGAKSRTCRVGADEYPCLFVDTSNVQGYGGFAVPSFGPSPVAAPFYVYKADGREYRHFLSEHSGYAQSIWAELPLGANARTSLTWHFGEAMCDTLVCGSLDPQAPSTHTLDLVDISGYHEILGGDFDGDGRGDLFLYGPGSNPDYIWWGTGTTASAVASVSVKGLYQPFVGDFNGDGRDDIFWYGPGGNGDSLWRGHPSRAFQPVSESVKGVYTPLAGDFNGDGRDDIVWYGSGLNPDAYWLGRTSGWTPVTIAVNGVYDPLVGDFNRGGADDIFWYGPGVGKDSLWFGEGAGWTYASASVGGIYSPFVADLSGDGRDDIVWYGPGLDYDSIWTATGSGVFAGKAVVIDGVYEPVVIDYQGNHRDDIVWYVPGIGLDPVWIG